MDITLEDAINKTENDFALAISAFCLRVGAANAEEFIDNMEAFLAGFEQAECPVNHHFFDGLYSRECFIPAGAICVTDEHETCHPLFLMRGILSVWTKDHGVTTLYAPCAIRTTPGTRRILYSHSDTVGITVHATTETDPEVIRRQITSQRINPLRSLS